MKVYEFIVTSKYIKVMIFFILLLFLVGTLGYSYTRNVEFSDAFVYTLETLVFFPPENPSVGERGLQIFIMLFGVFVFWFVLWTSLDLAIEGKFEEYFKKVRAMKRTKKMKDHYIICGGGRVGEHIAELLKDKREKYVIVDREEPIVNTLQRKGFNAIEGDILEESVMLDAGIKHAKAIISVLPETEKNILVTLTARDLNPKIKIYARAERKEMVKRLLHAGADLVVMPEVVGAEEIAKEIFEDKVKESV